MPEIPAEAVQAAVQALRTKQWGSRSTSAHGAHRFHGYCEVCQRNVEAIAEVALEAAAPFLAGAGSPTTCPSVASDSTESAQTPSAAPVYRPGVEKPTESLSAPHGVDAHSVVSSHASEHADLRQRCADRLLAKDAESWGYGTFEGDHEAALALADEVLAVRDDELARALRIADYHAGLHRSAEAVIARAKAEHARDDSNPHGPWCGTCLTFWPCRTWVALLPSNATEETNPHA